MDLLNKVGSWVNKITEVGVSVIALGVVFEVLFAKPQDFLQEQVKQPISQSQSSLVKNADMSTLNSYQKRLKILAKNTYSGIQGEIYD